VCRETIQWATKDNRNYLRSATRLFSLSAIVVTEDYLCRRALQIQLVSLYCELGQWKNSLKLGASILPELKK
jgi:hypothetical protein